MTTPIAPSAIPQFGTPPSTEDPANFDVRMDDTLSKLVVFVDATNAAADDTYQNAQSAFENATASASDVVLTAASEVAAEAALADTVIAKDLAEAAATAANLSSVSATAAKDLAEAAATQVDVAGALAGLPPKAGSALKVVRVKADGTGFEYAPALERLHVLSDQASTRYSVSTMLPIFDATVATVNSLAAKRVFSTGAGFALFFDAAVDYCETSPDGKVWTQRSLASTENFVVGNNGSIIVAQTDSASGVIKRSLDGGVTWGSNITVGVGGSFICCASDGKFLMGNIVGLKISSDNGLTWSASQTTPHSTSRIFALGANFVSHNIASGTYYTSITGLTGSWTARTLPDGITANKFWEDGAGGLVVSSTTTSKNLWRTVDGIAWTDLGFSQDTLKYGGLSAAASNSAALVCPVYINGNWVLFNGTSGAAGAGAFIKYAGNTWTPMLVDMNNLANTTSTKLLVATNNAGVTVIRETIATNRMHIIDKNSDKCMGFFIN